MKTQRTPKRSPAQSRGPLAAAICAFLFSIAGCSGGPQEQGPKKGGMPAPVRVVQAVKKDVPLELEVVGNVEAYSTVSVTSQVNGQVDKIHFKEGAYVKTGDMLITIDPRPFKAALDQAEAALARDMAQQENAAKEAARYAGLIQKGFVSQSQYDQLQSAADALKAVVAADKAAVANAKLQLDYCHIRSPINGKTGAVLIDEGNLVKANDKTLVTVMRIQPVFVDFSAPQQRLSEIMKFQAQGQLKVTALPSAPGLPPQHGVLTFIDNGVDPATGTIKLKAEFDNKSQSLWPGQFVNIVLRLTVEKDVVAVPSEAVQASQKGQYVYAVKPDGTAEMKTVTVSRSHGEESIISSGVEPGETVITDGQLQVLPGGKVKIVDDNANGKPGK